MDAFLSGMSWDTGERHDMGEMNIDGGLFFFAGKKINVYLLLLRKGVSTILRHRPKTGQRLTVL